MFRHCRTIRRVAAELRRFRRAYHPGPEFEILDGDFYGPNAEEFAGYFERTMGGYDLRGVFGGKRETDDE
ncbi:MAG: transferrin-binding protein-like solute binding protein [Chromatiales bacterium]|nr:transferrin-binding protein-like solute binding protein [Chromatiales bacterium]